MTSAGDLRESIHLQVRSEIDDGFGNVTSGPFETVHTMPARIRVLKGSETVIAGRLAGTQTAVLTVRSQPAMTTIDTSWRAVDARRGTVFNIRSITPSERGDYFDILCQSGVAT